MPFSFDNEHCEACEECQRCIEDRRNNPVRGRKTKFRLKQANAIACTFGGFVPGTDSDPDPTREYEVYLDTFRNNVLMAGQFAFGNDFDLSSAAIAKVNGDVFELLEAAALWNAMAAWNTYMDTGNWTSGVFTVPSDAVVTPTRKVAVIKLPRGYDATKLFDAETRGAIRAHETALRRNGMELGLSCPDIVGVRLPHPLAEEYRVFLNQLPNLGTANLNLLETAYQRLEGHLQGHEFMFALAVKTSTRSDRLYQPLFEANILKYLIEFVTKGAACRFYVNLGSFEGADVQGHYNAALLASLIRGGVPVKAVDKLFNSKKPVASAQAILDDLPAFPN
jgi:hypothetical protein